MTTKFCAVFMLILLSIIPPALADDASSGMVTGHIEGRIFMRPADLAGHHGIPGHVAVMDASGAIVAYATSDPDGLFQIDLQPGDYKLRIEPANGPSLLVEPQPVSVKSGEVTKTVLTVEAGSH